MKEKKLSWNLLKLCSVKDTLKRMKRQGIGWERHMQITYLIKDTSQAYKELLKFNNKKSGSRGASRSPVGRARAGSRAAGAWLSC